MASSEIETRSIVLVIGSRNQKKCKEMSELISPRWEPSRALARLSIRSVADYEAAPEVIEDADSFAGNARKKAAEVARALMPGSSVTTPASPSTRSRAHPESFPQGMPASRPMTKPITASCWKHRSDCRRQARCGLSLRLGTGGSDRNDQARSRGCMSRTNHPRGPWLERIWLRSAFLDPRIPQNVWRDEFTGQASAQPSRPRICELSPRPYADDRSRRTRFRSLKKTVQ